MIASAILNHKFFKSCSRDQERSSLARINFVNDGSTINATVLSDCGDLSWESSVGLEVVQSTDCLCTRRLQREQRRDRSQGTHGIDILRL